MALSSNPIYLSLKKIATEVFNVKNTMGDTSTLATTDKTLVGAINELANKPTATGGITEERAQAIVKAEFNKLTEGADAALDTFVEVGNRLKSGESAAQTLLSEVSGVKTRLNDLETANAEFAELPTIVGNILTKGTES